MKIKSRGKVFLKKINPKFTFIRIICENIFKGGFTMWKKTFISLLVSVWGVFFLGMSDTYADSLMLYTPYTGISVTPGEDISYGVDVINDMTEVQHVTFSMEDLPEGWIYSIRAGGNSIQQLSIRPEHEEEITIEVNAPLEIDKGDYRFNLVANSEGGVTSNLPFLVKVSEQGTFKTEFSTDQPNLEGHADSEFSYTTTLKNQTAEDQHYGLSAKAPKGWSVQFKADGSSVTSVTIEPNQTKDITVDIIPAANVIAEKYTIPITASSGSATEELELEAVITGRYSVELTPPSGNLSSDIVAGGNKIIDLVIENNGTAELGDINLSANTPPNWKVSFNHDSIATLAAGEQTTVKATVTAPDDAIAGDYVTTFNASTAEVSSDANFRMSVKTSTLWGVIAVAIIIGVVGGLYMIIRKYGRR